MHDYEQRLYDMYRRALACRDAELSDMPANSAGAEAAVDLRAAVGDIEQRDAAQVASAGTGKEGTAQKQAIRENIKAKHKRLYQTAQTIARKKPGFAENFRPPRENSDQARLASARSAHQSAVENKADFTRLGISEDFLANFFADIQAFEGALNAVNAATATRGASVAGIDQAFERAEEAFEILDTFVRNHYAANPQKLAAWRLASHVERPPRNTKISPQTQ